MKKSSQKCVWPQIWPPTRLQFNNYRGVAQLIARRIWEHRRCSHRTKAKTAESPSTVWISGGSEKEKSSQKCVWPQIWPPTRPQLNKLSGYSAVGSARHLGCWGREFESPYSDHKSTVISIELRRTFSTTQNRLKQGIQAYNKPRHRVLLRKSDPATLNMAVEFFIIRWYN